MSRESGISPVRRECVSITTYWGARVLLGVLIAMALPALVAGATIGLGRALGTRVALIRCGLLSTGSAIGLAYIAGQAAIARPSFPPVDVTDRLPWLALAAMLVAAAEAIWPHAFWLRFLGRALLLSLVFGLMLGPVLSTRELTRTTIGWLAASIVTAALAWLNIGAIEGRSRGTDAYHSLILTSAGTVPVLLFSGSAVLCILGVVLTVSLSAARIASWNSDAVSGLIVGEAVLTALVLESYVYASMSPWSALFLAIAPAGAWIARTGPLRSKNGFSATLPATIAVLVPIGLAIGWAVGMSLRE